MKRSDGVPYPVAMCASEDAVIEFFYGHPVLQSTPVGTQDFVFGRIGTESGGRKVVVAGHQRLNIRLELRGATITIIRDGIAQSSTDLPVAIVFQDFLTLRRRQVGHHDLQRDLTVLAVHLRPVDQAGKPLRGQFTKAIIPAA